MDSRAACTDYAYATDVGLSLPLRVYNKTGTGYGNFVDAGRFETDASAWVAAVMVAGRDGSRVALTTTHPSSQGEWASESSTPGPHLIPHLLRRRTA